MSIDLKIYENKMKLTLDNLIKELKILKVGSISSDMLNSITVEAYGTFVQINQLATFSNLDQRTLLIRPYDNKSVKEIASKIQEANLGFAVNLDNSDIKVIAPHVTEEKRKEVVKIAKNLTEELKIKIRNIRRDAMEELKKNKSTASEDQIKRDEDGIQKITDKFIKECENIFIKKELELMKF